MIVRRPALEIDRRQPQRRQEDDEALHRVALDPERPFQTRVTASSRVAGCRCFCGCAPPGMAVPMEIRIAKSVARAVNSMAGAESIMISPISGSTLPQDLAARLEGGGARL